MKEKVQAPELRFDGFTDDWELRKLTNITSSYSGLTYSPTDIQDTGTFVLRSSNVKNDQLIDADNVYVNPDIVNSINVKVGDVIIVVRNGSRALIGKHAIVNEEMPDTVIGAFMSAFRGENGNYINALLSTDNFQKEVHKSLGATINQITGKDFSMMIFPTPKFGEQQKIGAFFKQLDYTIALHQRKLEKSKALKSAYLSEMFPAEGERKPKRRFAGFTDDWEQRKLGDVSPLRGGYAFQSEKFRSQGVPIIRISNILSDGNIGGNYAFYDEQETDDKYSLPDGAALLAMSGATTGKVAILSNPDNTKFYQNQRVGYFSDLKIVNYDFVSTIVKSNLFISQLSSVLVAGAQPNVSSKEIDSFGFYFPKTLKEQTKIGTFFKHLDNTIALHQHKLEKLKNIKQAYLNELFV